jgi:type VI secretion system secreted protein VgrG
MLIEQEETEESMESDAPEAELDIDLAVEHLNDNARARSEGRCAKAVRLALLAGGLRLRSYPEYAKHYGPTLLENGFSEVPQSDYSPRKGDIVVIQNYRRGHIAGHIAMYTGRRWVSDFRQVDIWAGSDYRTYRPAHAIYRFGE